MVKDASDVAHTAMEMVREAIPNFNNDGNGCSSGGGDADIALQLAAHGGPLQCSCTLDEAMQEESNQQ